METFPVLSFCASLTSLAKYMLKLSIPFFSCKGLNTAIVSVLLSLILICGPGGGGTHKFQVDITPVKRLWNIPYKHIFSGMKEKLKYMFSHIFTQSQSATVFCICTISFFCQHFKVLYLRHDLTDIDQTWSQVPVDHPIYVIWPDWGQRSRRGHRGQKGHFH